MDEVLIDNQKKYENYKEQFRRLNKALTNGFNLEAIFIEYAIMEDRTESILRHTGHWEEYLQTRRDGMPTINSKIKFIQRKAAQKKHILNKYFSDDLLSRVIVWKDKRNPLIHALLKQQLAHNELKELAEQGNELVKCLRTRTGSLNRAIDKLQQGQ